MSTKKPSQQNYKMLNKTSSNSASESDFNSGCDKNDEPSNLISKASKKFSKHKRGKKVPFFATTIGLPWMQSREHPKPQSSQVTAADDKTQKKTLQSQNVNSKHEVSVNSLSSQALTYNPETTGKKKKKTRTEKSFCTVASD